MVHCCCVAFGLSKINAKKQWVKSSQEFPQSTTKQITNPTDRRNGMKCELLLRFSSQRTCIWLSNNVSTHPGTCCFVLVDQLTVVKKKRNHVCKLTASEGHMELYHTQLIHFVHFKSLQSYMLKNLRENLWNIIGTKPNTTRQNQTKHNQQSQTQHDKTKQNQNRSEERRVGKECRSRWSPYH